MARYTVQTWVGHRGIGWETLNSETPGMEFVLEGMPKSFGSRREAEQAIQRLRTFGADWRESEYRVVPASSKRKVNRDPQKRPDSVTRIAQEIYDHADKDRLLKAINSTGWSFVREVPSSGAWWIQKGNYEVMIVFGGPHNNARAFSWRTVGGPTERI